MLLPLKPPNYVPRVMVLGGSAADAQQTAEWIDLSAANPAWEALPNLNVPRDKVNSVLLPDGRVLVVGGIETLPDGGPAEIFDPDDPTSGFAIGPNMKHIRGYHSAALLMPDGSVDHGRRPEWRHDAERAVSSVVLLQTAADHQRLAGDDRLWRRASPSRRRCPARSRRSC